MLQCTAWVVISRSTGRCFLYYEKVTKVGAINRVVVVVVVHVFVAAAGVGAGCCGFIIDTINRLRILCNSQLRSGGVKPPSRPFSSGGLKRGSQNTDLHKVRNITGRLANRKNKISPAGSFQNKLVISIIQ